MMRSYEEVVKVMRAAHMIPATALFKKKLFVKLSESGVEEPDEDKMMKDIIDSLAALVRIQALKGTFMKTARSKAFFASLPTISGCDSFWQQLDTEELYFNPFHACFPGQCDIVTTDANQRSWHPLHWASMSSSFRAGDIKALVDEDTESLMRVDCVQQKATAGHYAVAVSNPSISTLQVLVASFPRIAFVKDASDCVMLHWAAQYSRSVETLQYLLQLNPEATKAKDKQNNTPLNLLLNRKYFPELLAMVRCLAEADPSSLLIASNERGCPLHTALFRKEDEDFEALVDLLLSINPESAKVKGRRLQLPLHTACSRETAIPLSVIRKLLAVYEEAVGKVDGLGWLPIHWASQWSTVDVVKYLLPLCPAALPRTATQCVTTMMHRTAARIQNDGCDMIEFIHSVFPESVRVKDEQGHLPLHYAAFYGKYFSTTEAIYRLHPAAIKVKDANGELPLYKVICLRKFDHPNGDDMKVLRFLLNAYPQGVAERTKSNDSAVKGNVFSYVDSESCPVYQRRAFLLAMPTLKPAELRRLNYVERRGAMFLIFAAVCRPSANDAYVNGLRNLMQQDGMFLLKILISYL
jgi:ankyrin repeat protein